MGLVPPIAFPRAVETVCVRPTTTQHPTAGPHRPRGLSPSDKSRTSACSTPLQAASHGTLGCAWGQPPSDCSGAEANLTEWGRWKRKTQARHYAKAPKSWKLPEHLSLPYPEQFSGFLSCDMGGVSICTKELWPKEASERRAGPHKPAPKALPTKVTGGRGKTKSGAARGGAWRDAESDSSSDSSELSESSESCALKGVEEQSGSPPPPPDAGGTGTSAPVESKCKRHGGVRDGKRAQGEWRIPVQSQIPPAPPDPLSMNPEQVQTMHSTPPPPPNPLRSPPPSVLGEATRLSTGGFQTEPIWQCKTVLSHKGVGLIKDFSLQRNVPMSH